jgi:hypothetical protein
VAQTLSDYQKAWSLGQNAYNTPDLILDGQYAKGVNVTTRRGILRPRYGFHQLQFTFDKTTIRNAYGQIRTSENLFYTGKFQGMAPYMNEGIPYLIVVISGYVFRVDTVTNYVQILSTEVTLNQFTARVNWTVASEWLVLYDFPNFPVLVNGDQVTRSNPNFVVGTGIQPQVPVSVMGAYNNNRLWIANARSEYTAGDPVGSLATPFAPITFAEVLTPGSPYFDQSFQLGTANSNEAITAMGLIQQIDTSTGFGPLYIATENAVYTVQSQYPRSQWEALQGFASVAIFQAGIVGPRAVVNTNSDFMFMTPQGKIHTFSTARNDSKRWGNLPISREVENYLTFSDPELLKFTCAGYFNNYVFFSANPYRTIARTVDNEPILDYLSGGFIVLNLDNAATLNSPSPPVWDGLWTGVNPMEIVNMGNRCFIMSKDQGARNSIHELSDSLTFDRHQGVDTNVKSIIYTREYSFDSPFLDKTGTTISAPVRDIKGDFSMTIEKKPSHASNFTKWGIEWKHVAPYRTCKVPSDLFVNGFAPHNFKQVVFGDSPVNASGVFECAPVTQDLLSVFRKIQLRITIEGRYWELEELMLQAVPQPTIETDNICALNRLKTVAIPEECSPDWATVEDSLCEEPKS